MNTVAAEAREPGVWSALWSALRLPIQILLLGLIILLLIWISTKIRVPLFDDISKALAGANVLETIVAMLVFFVGLAFAGFLWWVVGRYFALVASGKELSSLKDLPMGLPEGSIRSLLAMIVAVVGIPLLVFSEAMHLSGTVSGYLNGIITGVFGFYFGTRAAGSSGQALNQIADARNRADQAEDERDQAVATADAATSDAAASKQQADAATRSSGFAGTVSKLNREVAVASSILDVIAPALPPGILPSGLSTVVNDARTALDTVKGVTSDTVSDGQSQILQTAITAITGSGGGSAASLGSLIKTAAPMLSGLAIPGIGAVTALTALISVGFKLGSAEFARWRARVLAAPLAHGLIEFGTVTPDDAHAALLSSPIFAKAFAEEQDRPGFDADLADAVLRDDAVDRLWQRYGAPAGDVTAAAAPVAKKGQPALFTDRSQVQAGLTEFNQVLLAARCANDLPNGLPPTVTTVLSQAKDPQIRAAATLNFSQATLNQIVNAASKASTPAANSPTNAQAAFDALVTLVGTSRQKGDDLLGAISEATS
jgi:hypothetical protein